MKTEEEKLKIQYDALVEQYETISKEYIDLTEKYTEVTKQNQERVSDLQSVMNDLKVMTNQAGKDAHNHIEMMKTTEKMRQAMKFGIFIEFDNNKENMKYFPIMSNLSDIFKEEKTITNILYTFTMNDLNTWIESVTKIGMKSQNKPIKIDPKDI